MTEFNWSEQIQDAVFKTWLETGGDEVKIAVLDTGVDLTHRALKHLNLPGHKFNAAEPGFNPALPNQFGNGNV
ncbi:MAG: hypothetical protein HY842_13675, partial [Bacteroidetes bacterium]|nr:hypothetical protein [Bacteroidota bacterium]